MACKVFWVTFDKIKLQGRGYADQGILEDLFAHHIWVPPGFPDFEHFTDDESTGVEPHSVMVLPGAYHRDFIPEVNSLIDQGRPGVLVVTEDEGSIFPWREINADHIPVWIQNPRADVHDGTQRGLPVGWTPATREAVNSHDGAKTLDWFFSGQVNHGRRKKCLQHCESIPNGELNKTDGFLKGYPFDEYMLKTCAAKVVPCPGGAITPDSFRALEALEAGAIPLVDTWGGRGRVADYWPYMLGETPPFPLVDDWAHAPKLVAELVEDWPRHGNRVSSWWAGWKRRFVHRFNDDLRASGAEQKRREGDRITVLMPTSPIPCHPSTHIIEETIASLRAQPGLNGCEMFIMCDGIRGVQGERKADYEEYLRRLIKLCRGWQNVWPIVFDKHMHQAGMTQEALKHVVTDAVLFVEHDTPVKGEIPWPQLVDAVQGPADLVRLHHETLILDCHQYLMLDKTPQDVCGIPLLKTRQWSQRPHVANVDFYRRILDEHFDLPNEKWMIEDRMYSVVEVAWNARKEAGWVNTKLWIYAPEGNMQRSIHLDGRGGDHKWTDE